MPRVNLLPWRDEIRQDREKRFYITLAISAVTMMLVVGAVQLLINGAISAQQDRNNIITAEILKLNEQIEEINTLQAQKDALLARMNIIQSLQGTRPLAVHLFDELVRTLPNGVYTSSISQSGKNLTIQGFAQSNARVSTFMRNIEKSEWLTDPTLTVIRTAESKQGKTSQFTLRAKQWSPDTDEDSDQNQTSKRKKAKKR
ncbi:MAG: pilus assembly protein PilN [Gammaproteobacteria bacterium]|nr:MAG: pilus assembly protein PilN [Gammaproteobacteria bacterium]RLA17144.1 MAG: pilus assembly protein PilN [Gammaproteobacteria bacterium]